MGHSTAAELPCTSAPPPGVASHPTSTAVLSQQSVPSRAPAKFHIPTFLRAKGFDDAWLDSFRHRTSLPDRFHHTSGVKADAVWICQTLATYLVKKWRQSPEPGTKLMEKDCEALARNLVEEFPGLKDPREGLVGWGYIFNPATSKGWLVDELHKQVPGASQSQTAPCQASPILQAALNCQSTCVSKTCPLVDLRSPTPEKRNDSLQERPSSNSSASGSRKRKATVPRRVDPDSVLKSTVKETGTFVTRNPVMRGEAPPQFTRTQPIGAAPLPSVSATLPPGRFPFPPGPTVYQPVMAAGPQPRRDAQGFVIPQRPRGAWRPSAPVGVGPRLAPAAEEGAVDGGQLNGSVQESQAVMSWTALENQAPTLHIEELSTERLNPTPGFSMSDLMESPLKEEPEGEGSETGTVIRLDLDFPEEEPELEADEGVVCRPGSPDLAEMVESHFKQSLEKVESKGGILVRLDLDSPGKEPELMLMESLAEPTPAVSEVESEEPAAMDEVIPPIPEPAADDGAPPEDVTETDGTETASEGAEPEAEIQASSSSSSEDKSKRRRRTPSSMCQCCPSEAPCSSSSAPKRRRTVVSPPALLLGLEAEAEEEPDWSPDEPDFRLPILSPTVAHSACRALDLERSDWWTTHLELSLSLCTSPHNPTFISNCSNDFSQTIHKFQLIAKSKKFQLVAKSKKRRPKRRDYFDLRKKRLSRVQKKQPPLPVLRILNQRQVILSPKSGSQSVLPSLQGPFPSNPRDPESNSENLAEDLNLETVIAADHDYLAIADL